MSDYGEDFANPDLIRNPSLRINTGMKGPYETSMRQGDIPLSIDHYESPAPPPLSSFPEASKVGDDLTFDPRQSEAIKNEPEDLTFDPAQSASFNAHDDSQTSPAHGYWEGLSTNKPVTGMFNMAAMGRETLPMAAAMLVSPLGAAAGAGALALSAPILAPVTGPLGPGAVGLAAAGAVEGPAAGAGEALRQGIVKMTGGEPNFDGVKRTALTYLAGPAMGKFIKGGFGVAGELGDKLLTSKAGAFTSEALAAVRKNTGDIMSAAATKGAEAFPELTAAVRNHVSDYVQATKAAYGEAKDALISKFGDQQIVPRKGMEAEMNAAIKAAGIDAESEADRDIRRSLGRLVSDANKPFSGSIEGAMNMSKRINSEKVYGKTSAIGATFKSDPRYQQAVGNIADVLHKRIDSVDADFGVVRQGYATAKQLLRDSKTFLESNDLPARVESALARGKDDLKIMQNIQDVIPETLAAFERLRTGIYANYFTTPLGHAVGYGTGYGSRVARNAAVASGVQHIPAAVLNENEAAKGGHK